MNFEHDCERLIPSDEDKWKTEIKTVAGAEQDYTISYQNLAPDTTYDFRVIAYNEFGISKPANSEETVSFVLFGCGDRGEGEVGEEIIFLSSSEKSGKVGRNGF